MKKLNNYIKSKLHPTEKKYLNDNLEKIIESIENCQNEKNNKDYIFIFLFAGDAASEVYLLNKLNQLKFNIKKIYLISDYQLNNTSYINNIKGVFETFLNKKTIIEMNTFETFNNLYFFSENNKNISNDNIICFAINSQINTQRSTRNKAYNDIANFLRYWVNTYKKKIIFINTGNEYKPRIINNIHGNNDTLLIYNFFH